MVAEGGARQIRVKQMNPSKPILKVQDKTHRLTKTFLRQLLCYNFD